MPTAATTVSKCRLVASGLLKPDVFASPAAPPRATAPFQSDQRQGSRDMRILALTAAALIATTGIATAGSKNPDSGSYREAFAGFTNGNVGPGNTGRNNGGSGNGNVGSSNSGNANVRSYNGFQSCG